MVHKPMTDYEHKCLQEIANMERSIATMTVSAERMNTTLTRVEARLDEIDNKLSRLSSAAMTGLLALVCAMIFVTAVADRIIVTLK